MPYKYIDEIERFQPDAVVTSEMLLGAMAAAERAGVPCAVLSPNIYLFPLPGVPPFGPGFLPAKGLGGRARDILVEKLSLYIFGRGTRAFNETRRALGLPVSLTCSNRPPESLGTWFSRARRSTFRRRLCRSVSCTPVPNSTIRHGRRPGTNRGQTFNRRPLILVGFGGYRFKTTRRHCSG